MGIYDHSPLLAMLRRELGTEPLDAEVGYVRLDTGEYVRAPATPESVFASCSIPGAFEPPAGPPDPDGTRPLLVDGGVVHVTPVGHALAIDPPLDQVVVISCNNLAGVPREPRPRNIVQLMRRVWEILYLEHQVADVDGYFRIEHILRQVQPGHPPILNREGRPYRSARVHFIQPLEPLPGTLDFSPAAMAIREAAGKAAAIAAMGEP
jgi:predicted acylesterase/phospholipase RssA